MPRTTANIATATIGTAIGTAFIGTAFIGTAHYLRPHRHPLPIPLRLCPSSTPGFDTLCRIGPNSFDTPVASAPQWTRQMRRFYSARLGLLVLLPLRLLQRRTALTLSAQSVPLVPICTTAFVGTTASIGTAVTVRATTATTAIGTLRVFKTKKMAP
jgi:hypothetical protein